MKKFSWFLIASLMLLNLGVMVATPAPATAASQIKVIVNEQNLSMEVPPQIDKGRTLVPLRAIFEALKADVNWNANTKTIIAKKDDTTIQLTVGQKAARKNGNTLNLDVPAKIVNGRTLVPVRFIGEAFNCQVNWNAGTRTVTVDQFAGLSGSIKLSGSTSVQPLAQELADAFMKKNPGAQITIAGGGSGVGVKDATEGKVNIGMVSRYLKAEEATTLTSYIIANDAVVVVLNPQNPVGKLTTEQVKKIFTGAIVNWKDLGGADAPIVLNARDAASGTGQYFIEHFLGKDGKVAATAKTHSSNGLVRQAVASNKNAIGYISMGYIDQTVKAPTLDGVVPNIANAKNGTYKVVRPFVMATKGEATGLTKTFIDYILSPAGRNIVAKDYIPVETD